MSNPTTWMVVGANRGIGLALVQALTQQPHTRVLASCRTPSDALTATGAQVISGVDVAQQTGVDPLVKAAEQLQEQTGAQGSSTALLDVLIHNAGILRNTGPLGQLDTQAITQQFAVNALAPLRVCQALAPFVRPGGKLVLVTSRMGSIADNTSGGAYGYRMSKAALNAAGKSLAHDLPQLCVLLVHPGYVRTDMTAHNGQVSVQESAAGILARTQKLTQQSSGSFVHAVTGENLSW